MPSKSIAPHLGRIGEGVGARVHDHRVRVPARPEPIAQLHVLVGPVVALVVVEQLLVPEVQGLLDLVGRHHVPGDAPAAQVVERRHEAGEQERGVERRRQRGREADAARHRRHDRDQRARIVKGRVLGVAQIRVHPSLVGARHREAVPEHDQIELGALERHRHVLPQLRPCPLVAGRSGDPAQPSRPNPACGLNAQNHIRCIFVIAALVLRRGPSLQRTLAQPEFQLYGPVARSVLLASAGVRADTPATFGYAPDGPRSRRHVRLRAQRGDRGGNPAFGVGPVGAMLLGMLTAFGGGIVRDVLVRDVPTVRRTEPSSTRSRLS